MPLIEDPTMSHGSSVGKTYSYVTWQKTWLPDLRGIGSLPTLKILGSGSPAIAHLSWAKKKQGKYTVNQIAK